MIKWKKYTLANYRTSELFEILSEFINLQTKLGKKASLITLCWNSGEGMPRMCGTGRRAGQCAHHLVAPSAQSQ